MDVFGRLPGSPAAWIAGIAGLAMVLIFLNARREGGPRGSSSWLALLLLLAGAGLVGASFLPGADGGWRTAGAILCAAAVALRLLRG